MADTLGETVVPVGRKHRGETLAQVAASDPDWIRWVVRKCIDRPDGLQGGVQDFVRALRRFAEREELF